MRLPRRPPPGGNGGRCFHSVHFPSNRADSLDPALLRPGRLVARKEFKALSELDANLLALRLGIKHHFDMPASLGEIYAMQKNQHTLVHEVDARKNTSSAIDDL